MWDKPQEVSTMAVKESKEEEHTRQSSRAGTNQNYPAVEGGHTAAEGPSPGQLNQGCQIRSLCFFILTSES